MKWHELLRFVSDEPIFHSALLMTAGVGRAEVEKQLSRWTRAGKLVQLRRGLYALAAPYGKRPPLPFLVANELRRPSYVSLQSALAYYGMIPEYVPSVTSVTTGRPGQARTPLGVFIYRHIKTPLFAGYRRIEVADSQSAFIATPEKGLLDLIYLTPHGDEAGYLEELRLQNLEALDLKALVETARASGSAKLMRAAKRVAAIAGEEEYVDL